MGHTLQSIIYIFFFAYKTWDSLVSKSLGKDLSLSFGGDEFQTPGPGTYDTADPSIYKDKAPLYSMTSRNVMPGDTTRKPGPGAHSPETVRSTSGIFILTFLPTQYKYSCTVCIDSVEIRIGQHCFSLLYKLHYAARFNLQKNFQFCNWNVRYW